MSASPKRDSRIFDPFAVQHLHFVGIKGTGMVALAEIFHSRGISFSGSDVEDRFYTDDILQSIGVAPMIGFDRRNVPAATELLVHSAAYDVANPEIAEANRRGIPCLTYPEVLGHLSRRVPSLAVAGVHGKTTTAAFVGAMVKAAHIPATVIVGSAVADFDGRAVLQNGSSFVVAETCEYRRHFLFFSPHVALITNIESDHQDYYGTEADMMAAFVEFGNRVVSQGTVVYCRDDYGATDAAEQISKTRGDLRLLGYGTHRESDVRISDVQLLPGESTCTVSGFPDRWEVRTPGEHSVRNVCGAAVALRELVAPTELDWAAVQEGVRGFRGIKRRSEVVGDVEGILVIDDYAHHPTAIRTTLAGYRQFYPGRRIVVDFMAHTYSRTEALIDEFSRSFDDADVLIVNEIYASAREEKRPGISGLLLSKSISRYHRDVVFEADFDAAIARVLEVLRRGDLFVTMGAGDNFRIGAGVVRKLKERNR